MAQTIQIKRGLEANRTGITPLLGELIWTTNDHDLWIGDGSTAGGIKITGNIENDYIPLTQRGANNGVATLDAGGLIPNSQIPPLAITATHVAANQTAQLALTVQEGDVCVRTDENKSYIALNATNGAMTDWQELLTPNDSVTSVNGYTGVVSLDTDDISEGTTNLYYTDARVSTYLSSTATLGGLSDVNINTIADGQVITWSLANSRWENTTIPSGVTDFVGLSDTPANFTGAGGQIVTVNAGATALEFTTNNIGNISDVTLTATADNDILQYNNGSSIWENISASSIVSGELGSISIDALTDVDTTTVTPTSGDSVLQWDGTNWVPVSSSAVGSTSFVGLSDTPANYTGAGGEFLKVNVGATAVEYSTIAFDDLSDVDMTTTAPSVNDIIGWDGTNWVPGVNLDGGVF